MNLPKNWKAELVVMQISHFWVFFFNSERFYSRSKINLLLILLGDISGWTLNAVEPFKVNLMWTSLYFWKHVSSCSMIQYFLHNLLFSNKELNSKPHNKGLVHELSRKLPALIRIFKQSFSPSCSHSDIMRSNQHMINRTSERFESSVDPQTFRKQNI